MINNSLYTTLSKTLKEAFPTISWKLGSLVRELILEPFIKISDTIDSYVSKVNRLLDIDIALESPDEYEDVLDAWMSKLNIQSPELREAQGVVSIQFTGTPDFIVRAGESFEYNDILFVVNERYEFSNTEEGKLQVTEKYSGLYSIEVPVTTTGPSSAVIAAGTHVSWSSAPDRVVDIVITKPICGGMGVLSAQAKANLIKDTLAATGFYGEKGILSTLRKKFPEEIIDVKLAANNDMAGVGVYIKSANSAELFSVNGKLRQMNDDTRVVAIPAAGVLSVKGLRLLPSREELLIIDVNTSNDECLIQVDVGFDGADVEVDCIGYNSISKCAQWLEAGQLGAIYKMYAKSPAYGELTIHIPTTATDLPLSCIEELQQRIIDTGLNPVINDGLISAVLDKYGIELSDNVLFVCDVHYNGSVDHKAGRGAINLTSYGNVPPLAVYMPIDNIRLTR